MPIEIGMRSDDPTRDIQAIRVKTTGYHSWSEDEIAQFEQRHPVGTTARLALALLLFTGQRRSDVIRMGRQHIRDNVLQVRQSKTGVELMIPVHADLHTAITACAGAHLTLLVTESGKPFAAGGFGNWFRKQCDRAGLPHCSAHGLRKAACRRLAEAGCSPHEIGAISGHATLKEIVRYTKAVDQRQLAHAAMDKMRTNTVKPARAV
jgi:integrase